MALGLAAFLGQFLTGGIFCAGQDFNSGVKGKEALQAGGAWRRHFENFPIRQHFQLDATPLR
jgi:hypothetical protein